MVQMEVGRAAGGLMDRYQRRVDITGLGSDLCELMDRFFYLQQEHQNPISMDPNWIEAGR